MTATAMQRGRSRMVEIVVGCWPIVMFRALEPGAARKKFVYALNETGFNAAVDVDLLSRVTAASSWNAEMQI